MFEENNNGKPKTKTKTKPSYLLNENELNELQKGNKPPETANAFAEPSSNNSAEHATTLASLKNNPLFQTLRRPHPPP